MLRRARYYRRALEEIRNLYAAQCPAWELEWDRVCSETDWADNEVFTVQEVRDAARRLNDPVIAVVHAALAGDPLP